MARLIIIPYKKAFWFNHLTFIIHPIKKGIVPNTSALDIQSKGGLVLSLMGGAEYIKNIIDISTPIEKTYKLTYNNKIKLRTVIITKNNDISFGDIFLAKKLTSLPANSSSFLSKTKLIHEPADVIPTIANKAINVEDNGIFPSEYHSPINKKTALIIHPPGLDSSK